MKTTFIKRKLPFALASLFVSSSVFAADIQDAANNQPSDAPSLSADANEPVTKVEITAAHLKSARVEMSPKVGTTVYSIDTHMLDTLGQGDSTPFDQVLLRFPGVAEDSKASGSLHIRDDHGNVQYRVNGVQLPEGISGFGQSIDTRMIDQTDFLTGALPAQYGLRTAGIVDIQTKEGGMKPGGQVGILVGSNQFVQPSFQLFGSEGNFNYYLSGNYLKSNIGIENPTSSKSPIHDHTQQSKSFGNFSYYLDDTSKVSLMFGTYLGEYQIPNNPAQAPAFSLAGVSDMGTGMNNLPSSAINENQNEINRFFVLTYQKNLGKFDYQISAYHQYSELHFLPDPQGDLVYNGVASDVLKNNSANGLQFDTSYKLMPEHTVRAGAAYATQNTESLNSVNVFATDNNGAQLGNTPINIQDNSSKSGSTLSFYLQDEWHVSKPLTINYGVRFDRVNAYINEQQWSPRLNVAYTLSDSTALHAGYSRYFTPPAQELVSQNSINLYANTTNAPAVPYSDNVKAERTHYFDLGLSHKVNDNLSLTADVYYKKIANLLDEGQFGQALILTPFNYETGFAKGLELSAIYNQKDWGGFLNFSYQKAMGKNIISGQSTFGQAELAYISQNYVYLDHDQTYTLSGGAHYHFGDSQISSDFLFGSGLRKAGADGVPNGDHLPGYLTLNAAYTYNWKNSPFGKVEARIAVLNLLDRVYELRDGTGIGVGAPQFGARRTLYAGLTSSF